MSGITLQPSYYLDSKELTTFRNGNFELHFLSMKVEKPAPDSKRFLGSGFMRQIPDGRFEYTMYSKKVTSTFEILDEVFGNTQIRPGKLIPETEYYTLTATDTTGRKWVATVLNPSKKSSSGGTLLTGKFSEISCQGSLPVKTKNYHLNLEFMGEYKIPSNTATKIDQTIEDKHTTISNSLNILKFSHNKIDFLFRQEDGALRIETTAKNKKLLIGSFEKHIAEGLQFVLGIPTSWSILTIQFGKSGKIVLRSSRKASKGNKPPVNPNIGYHEYFCKLFSDYLSYISKFPSERSHPVSVQIRSIAQASSVNIETLALVLSVAVESILKHAAVQAKVTKIEMDSIKNLKEYFENWDGPEQLKTRVRGLLSMLSTPSAKTLLNELVKSKVTTPKHKKAWGKLRDKLAHGGMMGSSSLQEFIDLTNVVLVLFYHLVFHITGYQGKYTDYSIDGWPEVEFPLNKDYPKP